MVPVEEGWCVELLLNRMLSTFQLLDQVRRCLALCLHSTMLLLQCCMINQNSVVLLLEKIVLAEGCTVLQQQGL